MNSSQFQILKQYPFCSKLSSPLRTAVKPFKTNALIHGCKRNILLKNFIVCFLALASSAYAVPELSREYSLEEKRQMLENPEYTEEVYKNPVHEQKVYKDVDDKFDFDRAPMNLFDVGCKDVDVLSIQMFIEQRWKGKHENLSEGLFHSVKDVSGINFGYGVSSGSGGNSAFLVSDSFLKRVAQGVCNDAIDKYRRNVLATCIRYLGSGICWYYGSSFLDYITHETDKVKIYLIDLVAYALVTNRAHYDLPNHHGWYPFEIIEFLDLEQTKYHHNMGDGALFIDPVKFSQDISTIEKESESFVSYRDIFSDFGE